MTERERFDKIQKKYPHPHIGFYQRPHATRRQFFRSLGAGLTGFYLAGPLAPTPAKAAGAATKNTAKQVIFIFLQGAPSHVDTFDFKFIPGVTPGDFQPETFNGITIPNGILGNTAQVLDKIVIVRSGLSWALNHPLAQTWFQIGRNPASALGRIAPHIGSVVAIEKEPERRPDQIFPTFIALNSSTAPGAGYFPIEFSPFKTQPSPAGLAYTTHPLSQSRFDQRWDLLQAVDAPLRASNSPLGAAASGMARLYENARSLMYNPTVSDAFAFDDQESLRYGNSAFGNACLVARKIVEADQGARFIQITLGGWDHHQNIYDRQEVNGREVGRNIYAQVGEFDPAFATLITDLQASGRLDDTLIVVSGEFGRTVGNLTNTSGGRDHFLQMFYVFAGGGISGGRVIGETDPTGAFTIDPGWSRFRDIRPEDVEATIYSALGIDWTTVRNDDPLGRGFPYVPLVQEDLYAPIDELWA